jgi:hypothetical protein
MPTGKRHDRLLRERGAGNVAALQAGAGPLWVCEGAFDALALRAAGVSRVVAIFDVHGLALGMGQGDAGAGVCLGHPRLISLRTLSTALVDNNGEIYHACPSGGR